MGIPIGMQFTGCMQVRCMVLAEIGSQGHQVPRKLAGIPRKTKGVCAYGHAPSFFTAVGLDLGSIVAAYSSMRSVEFSHLRTFKALIIDHYTPTVQCWTASSLLCTQHHSDSA